MKMVQNNCIFCAAETLNINYVGCKLWKLNPFTKIAPIFVSNDE
jgi:hypothetical protein